MPGFIDGLTNAVTGLVDKVTSNENLLDQSIAGPYAAMMKSLDEKKQKVSSSSSFSSFLSDVIDNDAPGTEGLSKLTSSLDRLASTTNTSPSSSSNPSDPEDAMGAGGNEGSYAVGQTEHSLVNVQDAMNMSDTYLDTDVSPDFDDNETALQSAIDALNKIVKAKGDTFETEREFTNALCFLSEYYEGATTFVQPEIFVVLMSTLNKLNCMIYQSSSYVVYSFGSRLLCLNLFDSTVIVS